MGHFLCPQPRGLLLSHSAGPLPPCTQAVHATGLGSIWNPVCEQKNCRLLFFSLFACFFPIAKQLQLPVGWCSGSGGCSCPQPREQNSSCVAVTPALTPQMPSQPQPAVLGALCSPVFTATPRAVLQEGWTQAVVASGGCNSRVRAETALQGLLCLTSVPTEASRAFGPLLGGSSCGGSRNRLWKPPVPCTP